jgi:hypothetical protein
VKGIIASLGANDLRSGCFGASRSPTNSYGSEISAPRSGGEEEEEEEEEVVTV